VVGEENKTVGCGVMVVRMLGSYGGIWGFSREPKGVLSGLASRATSYILWRGIWGSMCIPASVLVLRMFWNMLYRARLYMVFGEMEGGRHVLSYRFRSALYRFR